MRGRARGGVKVLVGGGGSLVASIHEHIGVCKFAAGANNNARSNYALGAHVVMTARSSHMPPHAHIAPTMDAAVAPRVACIRGYGSQAQLPNCCVQQHIDNNLHT